MIVWRLIRVERKIKVDIWIRKTGYSLSDLADLDKITQFWQG